MSLSVVTLEIIFLNFGVIRGALALVELPFWKTGAREWFFFWVLEKRSAPRKLQWANESCPWKWKVHSPAGQNASIVSG